AIQKNKRETEVSQRLINFVLQHVQTINPGTKVHNFYHAPKWFFASSHSRRVRPRKKLGFSTPKIVFFGKIS
ncbi:MAG: hypothetical protein SOU49_09260, partial [Sodaliphilus pleomorphus]